MATTVQSYQPHRKLRIQLLIFCMGMGTIIALSIALAPKPVLVAGGGMAGKALFAAGATTAGASMGFFPIFLILLGGLALCALLASAPRTPIVHARVEEHRTLTSMPLGYTSAASLNPYTAHAIVAPPVSNVHIRPSIVPATVHSRQTATSNASIPPSHTMSRGISNMPSSSSSSRSNTHQHPSHPSTGGMFSSTATRSTHSYSGQGRTIAATPPPAPSTTTHEHRGTSHQRR